MNCEHNLVYRGDGTHHCFKCAQSFPVSANTETSIPVFSEYADATLARVRATYAERGGQYGDTWREAKFNNLRAVLKLCGVTLGNPELRAIAAASLVDVKHSRMIGGYKEDNLIDGIAYGALLVECVRRLKET